MPKIFTLTTHIQICLEYKYKDTLFRAKCYLGTVVETVLTLAPWIKYNESYFSHPIVTTLGVFTYILSMQLLLNVILKISLRFKV
jgi:hypothetical protein